MWSWEEESLALPLDEIYVDMCVDKLDPLMSSQETLGNLDELFRDGKITRIYLYGEAGAGKTTLTQHLICVWSRHVLRAQHNVTGQELGVGKFQYVVPLFLRNVSEGNLYEAIREQLGLDSQETDLLLGNPQDILFVCEGYDEFNDTTCPDIARLVSADIFLDSSLLVTSRGQISLSVEKENVLPDCIVQLKGFTYGGVQAYINTFFSKIENPDTASLLKEIDESDHLKGLSNYPALLLLMCILWRESKNLAANVTEFFKDFVSYTCMRYERKIIHPRDQTSKEQVLNMFKTELLKIGEVAADGLKKEKMQLVFGLNEVKQRIGEKAWKLGFFKQNEEKRWTVSFHHELLQEYFAAFFIVHCSKETRTKLLMDFYKLPNHFKESTMFTKFLTGLGRNDIVRQVANVIGNGREQCPRILTDLHLQHIAECTGETFQLPSHVELSITKSGGDIITRYLSLDGSGLSNIQIEINRIEDLSILRHLQAPHLEVLNVMITGSSKCHTTGPHWALCNILPRFGNLHTLRCKTVTLFDNNQEGPLSILLKGLHKLSELRILDLTGTCLHRDTHTTLHCALSKLFGLQHLMLEKCGINGDMYMESIVGALKNLKHIILLYLAKNTGGNRSFKKLVDFLANTDTLQQLSLWDQVETCNEVSVLLEGLSNHRQLECLDMRGIVCNFNSMGGMPELFRSCFNLKVFKVYGLEFSLGSESNKTSFVMRDVEVGAKEMKSIAKHIIHFRELLDLSVCNCSISEASGWIAFFESLKSLTALRSVSIERTNVDACALKHLHGALRALPVSSIAIVDCQEQSEQKLQPILEGLPEYSLLHLLNLSYNKLSNIDINMVANALPKLNCLTTLKLVKCSITGISCTQLFIQSLGKCSSLQSLNLDGNDLRDDMIEHISVEIPRMRNLQSISLSDCGLIGFERAVGLLEVLCQSPNIQILDLSRNFIGDYRNALYHLENKAREVGVAARVQIYSKSQMY